MKALILDTGALTSVTPSALRGYATFEGWQPVEAYGETSEVYSRRDGDRSVELILPVTDQIGDYASVVSQVIRVFAREGDRDELSIFRDLLYADRDVIRVRSTDADDTGSIPLEAGVELVSYARDLLSSAACAAFEPRRSYHLGKVQQANQYMEKVKLGQTEVGSFIVTLIAPVPPALSLVKAQHAFWPEIAAEPFERRVTRVLASSLDAARDALSETNRGRGQTAFDAAVKSGVSANLCEAIAAIAEKGSGSDISLMWARTRPTPQPSKRIWFSKDDSAVLREAARQFRLKEPRDDVELIGIIERCRREAGASSGLVSFAALIDGRAQMVTAELLRDDYERAVEAHKNQNAISLTGELRREGQRWRLHNARQLTIIAGNEEDEITKDT